MDQQKLEACGIDYEEGMHRFSGHTAIYEKYLRKMPGLDIYEEMRQAFLQGDCHEAFEGCHKLKAFVGNLSIHPLYENICELTEKLRPETGITDEMKTQAEEIDKMFHQVADVIKSEEE